MNHSRDRLEEDNIVVAIVLNKLLKKVNSKIIETFGFKFSR